MKKKVLLVFDHLEFGGGTRALINVSKALSKGYSVDILAGFSDESGTFEIRQEVEASCENLYTYPITFHTSEMGLTFQVIKGVFSVLHHQLKLEDYDAICLNLTKSSIPFIIRTLTAKLRLIYFFHGSSLLERMSQYSDEERKQWPLVNKVRFSLLNAFLHFFQRLALSLSSAVICFSHYSQSLVSSLTANKSIYLLHPPVYVKNDCSRKRKDFGLREDAVVTLITSRIEPRKGLALAIEAANLVCKEHPNLFFYSVGPTYHGEYFNQLFLSLRGHRLGSRFVFWGPLPHDTIGDLLPLADLLIMPSIDYETLGFSTLEALSCSVPVIGFNSGATPEILGAIDKHLIANQLTATSLASRIDWFMQLSRKDRNHLKHRSAQYVQKEFSETQFLHDFSMILS